MPGLFRRKSCQAMSRTVSITCACGDEVESCNTASYVAGTTASDAACQVVVASTISSAKSRSGLI